MQTSINKLASFEALYFETTTHLITGQMYQQSWKLLLRHLYQPEICKYPSCIFCTGCSPIPLALPECSHVTQPTLRHLFSPLRQTSSPHPRTKPQNLWLNRLLVLFKQGKVLNQKTQAAFFLIIIISLALFLFQPLVSFQLLLMAKITLS